MTEEQLIAVIDHEIDRAYLRGEDLLLIASNYSLFGSVYATCCILYTAISSVEPTQLKIKERVKEATCRRRKEKINRFN